MTKEQFNNFILQYQQPIISIIYKMVFSWESARDLAQESFIRLWKLKDQLIKDKPVFTLLYRIAMNLSIDFLRKNRNLIFEDINENTYDPQEHSKEFTNILFDCCKKLKPQQRAVFNLRDLEGLTFEEISDILETPVVNIRSNLHLARKNVKQILYDVYEIDEEYFNEM